MKKFKIYALLVLLLTAASLTEAAPRFSVTERGSCKKFDSASSTKTKSLFNKSAKTFTVTLTTYWAQGKGSDYWTRKFTSSTGQRLVAGVSVAADPRVIPYGSLIEIKGLGRRVVKDTGSHVISRLASLNRGVNYPVIDLFFERRDEALRFARSSSPFAEVKIIRYGI